MNPSSNEASGLSLPAPVPEQGPATTPQAEQVPAPAETAGGAERAPAAPTNLSPVPPAMPPMQAPVFTATPNADSAVDASARGTAAILKNDDLIDKEMVERAKRVIEGTHDNPYKQTEEISAVKSDYLQKNFNKSLKLNS